MLNREKNVSDGLFFNGLGTFFAYLRKFYEKYDGMNVPEQFNEGNYKIPTFTSEQSR